MLFLLTILSGDILFARDLGKTILERSSDKDAKVSNSLALGFGLNFPGIFGLSLTYWLPLKYIGIEAMVFYLDENEVSTLTRTQGKVFFCFRHTKSVRNYIAVSMAKDTSNGETNWNYENLLIGTETFSTLKNPKVSYIFEVGFGRGYQENVSYTATGVGVGMKFYF